MNNSSERRDAGQPSLVESGEAQLGSLVRDVRRIILDSRGQVTRSVSHHRVLMYWRIGCRIVEEAQGGAVRAKYGAYTIRGLAERSEPEFGLGFSVRQLELARQFYQTYPIANALRSQSNWAQSDENPTMGVLLCADKNDAVVRFSLPENNQTILTSRYQLYLPAEEQLAAELR